MGHVNDIRITLSDDASASIETALATGHYTSVQEVIEDALRHMNSLIATTDAAVGIGDDEIARLWDEGIASGPGTYDGLEDILAEARSGFGKRAHRQA